MTIRTPYHSTRVSDETAEPVPHQISFLNERLSKFLNDHAIAGDVINGILQRKEADLDSIYTADRKIQLTEQEAEYILRYFPQDHRNSQNLNQEFANDIQNIKLASELSSYIQEHFDFDEDEIAEILGIEYVDNQMSIPAAQVANITGAQWRDFRNWIEDFKGDKNEEVAQDAIERFKEIFENNEIVQDKINKLPLTNPVSNIESSDLANVHVANIKNAELVGKLTEDINVNNSSSTELNQIISANERAEYSKIQGVQIAEIDVLNTKIINKALKLIETKRQGKFSWKERNNLQRKLGAVLDTCDEGYIKTHQEALVRNIVNNLSTAVEGSWFNKSLNMKFKKLDQYLLNLKSDITAKNTEFVIQHLKKELFNHKISDSELEKRLSKFVVNTQDRQGNFGAEFVEGESKKYDFAHIADLRKLNPRIFDSIVFPEEDLKQNAEKNRQGKEILAQLSKKGNLTKSSEAFATDILAEVVKGCGGKIESKEVDKIFNKLHEVLSSLDSQYLANEQEQIISGITISLNQYGEINKRNQQFTISTKALVKVKKLIEDNHQQANSQFVAQQVASGLELFTTKLFEHQVPNTELYKRVEAIVKTNNMQEVIKREKIFSTEQLRALQNLPESSKMLSAITNEQLVRLRRLDPQLFDSTIFLPEDITNRENKKVEFKEKFLPDIKVEEERFRDTTISKMKLKAWDIVNPNDDRVKIIDQKNKVNKARNSLQASRADNQSINSSTSARSSISDRSAEELLNTPIGSISSRSSTSTDSAGYHSDSTLAVDQQPIRADSFDIGSTALPISKPESDKNLDSIDPNNNHTLRDDNTLIRSTSVDSGIGGSISSRSVSSASNNEYDNQFLTAASSMESLGFGLQEGLVMSEEQDTKSANINPVITSNLSDLDQGYGSHEDLAVKDPDPSISSRVAKVAKELKDIGQLVGRLYTYKVVLCDPVSQDRKPVAYHESTLSVLELGGEWLRNNASDEKIEELLKGLKENTEAAKALMDSEAEKNKADYLLARLEANLKGFILPHLPDDSKAFQIVKSILLEVQDQHLPKDQYVSTVTDKAKELWAQTDKTPHQIKEFEDIIKQGDQKERMKEYSLHLNAIERATLSKATNAVITSIITELPFNKIGEWSPEIENAAKMFILKANLDKEDLVKVTPHIGSITIHQELVYALLQNIATQRDKKINDISEAIKNFPPEQQSNKFISAINLVFQQEYERLTSDMAENLIKQAIGSITGASRNALSAQHQEVFRQLTPILTNLDFIKLQTHKGEIVQYLQKCLNENKTWVDKFKSLVPGFDPTVGSLASNKLKDISIELTTLYKGSEEPDPLVTKIMTNLIKTPHLKIDASFQAQIREKLTEGISNLDQKYRKNHEEQLVQDFNREFNQEFNKQGGITLQAVQNVVETVCKHKEFLPNKVETPAKQSDIVDTTISSKEVISAAPPQTVSFTKKILEEKNEPANKNGRSSIR
ncbi:hypothetical protein [Candidatus Tisiphia endosymbiont of Nemotelus uliginosus]|uniref:hypothetical protein n=1 Tax=Candidatus Tisiphia endosymbiont of Nemotelus uliginosus TaxID=3077926 RepID=UPI0035C88EFB